MFAQLRHNKSLTLLLSLLLLILIFPFFETSRVGNLLFILLYSTVLISGIYAISYDARYLAVGILLAAPVLICQWSNIILNNASIDILARVCSVIFMAYTIMALLIRVLKAPSVGPDEIYGAVCAYVLIGTVFGLVYFLIETLHPHSFHFSNDPEASLAAFVYFSFVTLSTAGFGDIVAVLPFARSLTIIEIIIGVTFVAVLIGRLISASQQTRQEEETAGKIERHRQEKVLHDLLRDRLPLAKNPAALVLSCVLLNFATSILMIQSGLPFFLDSWGTSLAVILGGWWPGAAAAVCYNLLIAATHWGWGSWIWALSSLLVAGVTWFFSKKGWISIFRPLHLVLAGMAAGLLNSILVQAIIYFANMPAYQGTLAVYRFFLRATSSGTFAALAEKFFVEIGDKAVSVVVAAVAAFLLRDLLENYKVNIHKRSIKAGS